MTGLRKIIIDGIEVEADPSLTLIQVCDDIGIEIPRFCYHERLSIAGNCRMCLVEVVGGPPKPAASCHLQVRDLRPGPDGAPPEVRTNSPMVKKAREGVMEFLLINHPLDCPICDQGGECDLQDQSIAYGTDFSRLREPKRAVVDLNLGPLIATHMTRCIHCTRCVRFMTEVAGVAEMGTTGRGEDMRIVSFENEMLITEDDAVAAALRTSLSSEMQGNIVDLCPVGALTNKPYAFTARPWELRKINSIDVMDALGSNIRVDCRGREVMRILPRNHDGVNEEWLADRSRYHWDGLRRQRLDRPYIRVDGRLRPAGWDEAFAVIADAIAAAEGKIAAIAGDLVPVESMWSLKDLLARLGSDRVECRQDGAKLPIDNRAAYAGTALVEDLDTADAVLIIGANPRLDAPVLNARIRKSWIHGGAVGVIGEAADLTYSTTHLGESPALLAGEGRDKVLDFLKDRESVVIIIGAAALTRPDGGAILGHAMAIAESSGAKLMVLHRAASRVGGMDVGFAHADGLACLEGAEVIYNLGADEVDIAPGPFVIYHGSHGDRGAHRADVILPGAAYAEQSGIFVNLEGRPQMGFRASFPPGEAREDWAILRALSGVLGQTQPWDSLPALRDALWDAHPHLGAIDHVPENAWNAIEAGEITDSPIRALADDHWLANPILRASSLMQEMSELKTRRAAVMAAE